MAEQGVRGLLIWLSQLGHVPSDAHEALALAVHGLLVQHGFRPAEVPVGGEVHGGSGTEEGEGTGNANLAPQDGVGRETTRQPTLPAQWGAAGYGGRYRHHRSAMTFDVRAVAMGPRLIVHAAAVEDDDHMHTLELRTDRYVREQTDWSSLTQDGESGTEGTRWEHVYNHAQDLATLVQVNIAHRLVPDAAKDGYEASADAGESSRSESANAEATRRSSGSGAGSSVGILAGGGGRVGERDDDYGTGRDPLGIGRPMRPGRNPYGIPVGDDIYDPDGVNGSPFGFGQDDILAPGLPRNFGGGGFGIGGGEMGGNLMGPRHPSFGGGMGGGRRPGGGFGRGGLPPGVPPGARFDPYGPPDPAAGFGPRRGRGPLGGSGAGGGLGNQGGTGMGEPDNDLEVPPPPDNEYELPGNPPPDMYW